MSKAGLVLLVIAVTLGVLIYKDAKGSNVIPWFIVLLDFFLGAIGLLLLRNSAKSHGFWG